MIKTTQTQSKGELFSVVQSNEGELFSVVQSQGTPTSLRTIPTEDTHLIANNPNIKKPAVEKIMW